MPRKNNVIDVEPWPKLKVGGLYPGKVKGIRLNKASGYVHVTVENLEPVQANRIHELALSLPVHPGNKTALFFVACGVDTSLGTVIRLDRIANIVIGMRFRGLGHDHSEEFDFEKVATAPPAAGTGPSAGRSVEKTHVTERDSDGCENDSR